MKSAHTFFLSMTLLAASGVAAAQALPTASRAPFQVGVAGSIASSDYGYDYIKGYTVFGNFNFSRRLGLEADVHQTNLTTPDNVGESSYLAGVRYSVAIEERANIYLKALGGLGRFTYEPKGFSNPHTNTYAVGAFGGGIEFRATPRINIRAIDIEYQSWPGFPPHGLTPFVTSIGVAYTF